MSIDEDTHRQTKEEVAEETLLNNTPPLSSSSSSFSHPMISTPTFEFPSPSGSFPPHPDSQSPSFFPSTTTSSSSFAQSPRNAISLIANENLADFDIKDSENTKQTSLFHGTAKRQIFGASVSYPSIKQNSNSTHSTSISTSTSTST